MKEKRIREVESFSNVMRLVCFVGAFAGLRFLNIVLSMSFQSKKKSYVSYVSYARKIFT